MPPKRKADDPKKTIPPGKSGSLKGLKLIVTGTLQTDRETSKSTIELYGGEVVTAAKLDTADYVVIGDKAGQKKLDEIEEKGLKTLSEDEFLAALKSGDLAKGVNDADDGPVEDDQADEDDEDDEDDDEEPPPKKSKTTKKSTTIAAKKTETKAAPNKKAGKTEKDVTIVEGKEGALDDLKILFTGTFNLDRKSCEATAKHYGATIKSKLTDCDWIILGTKPGAKKVEEIKANELKTMNEEEFMHFVRTGEEPSA